MKAAVQDQALVNYKNRHIECCSNVNEDMNAGNVTSSMEEWIPKKLLTMAEKL